MTDNFVQEPDVATEQAYQLSQAAIRIDQARGMGAESLAAALAENVEVWIALVTIISRDDCRVEQGAKDNLKKLCKYVTDQAIKGETPTDSGIDTLININLQISEGLLISAQI